MQDINPAKQILGLINLNPKNVRTTPTTIPAIPKYGFALSRYSQIKLFERRSHPPIELVMSM